MKNKESEMEFDHWQTASEVIGNRYCIYPHVVKKVLRKLDPKCSKAFTKAIKMNEEEFIARCLVG